MFIHCAGWGFHQGRGTNVPLSQGTSRLRNSPTGASIASLALLFGTDLDRTERAPAFRQTPPWTQKTKFQFPASLIPTTPSSWASLMGNHCHLQGSRRITGLTQDKAVLDARWSTVFTKRSGFWCSLEWNVSNSHYPAPKAGCEYDSGWLGLLHVPNQDFIPPSQK